MHTKITDTNNFLFLKTQNKIAAPKFWKNAGLQGSFQRIFFSYFFFTYFEGLF